jgi:hypothetical protein
MLRRAKWLNIKKQRERERERERETERKKEESKEQGDSLPFTRETEHYWLQGSQSSPIRPSDRNTTKIKLYEKDVTMLTVVA